MKNKFIITAMCISIFLCMLDTTVMNIALPTIQDNLKADLNNLQWALNIYTIIFASLTIPLSRFAEKYGKHRFYLISLIVFSIGSLVFSCSTTLSSLIVGRAIQSVGAAVIFPLSMTIGINTVKLTERKGVIAALGVTQGLAAALGPTIGGILTQFLGWQWIFLINIPFMLTSLLICIKCLDLRENKESLKIDLIGALLSMVTLFSLTLGLVQGRLWGWTSPIILLLLIGACILSLLFIVWERHCDNPMVPLELFKNKEFSGSALAILLSNIFLVAVTVILPTYFTRVQGKSELVAALLVTPITAMIFIFSPLAAVLIDKLGSRFIIALGFVLITVSYILFTQIDMSNMVQTTITCLILGSGYGIITGPITVLAASDFTGNLLTASQSVAGVLRQIGIVLAVAIYVSGLYSNLSISKSESINYITEVVSTVDVSPSKQKIIIQNATDSLEKNESKKYSNNHYSDKETKKIIEENYNKVMSQYPSNISDIQKEQIHNSVEKSVKSKLDKINGEINNAINKIKKYTINSYTNAFTNLYKYSIVFTALSIFSFLFFPRKNI